MIFDRSLMYLLRSHRLLSVCHTPYTTLIYPSITR